MPTASNIASPAVLSARRTSANKQQADAITGVRDERLHLDGQLAEYQENRDGFRDGVERARILRRGLLLTLIVAAVVVTFDYLFAVGEVAGHMMQDYWQNRHGGAAMPAWVLNGGAVFLVAFIAATTLFFATRVFDTTELEESLRQAAVEEDTELRRHIGSRRARKWCYLGVLAMIFGGLWTVSYDKARQAAENAAEDRRQQMETTTSPAPSIRNVVNGEAAPTAIPSQSDLTPTLSAAQRLTLKCTAVALVLVFLGHLALSGCPTYGVWRLPRPIFSENSVAKKSRKLAREEKKDATALWLRIAQMPEQERQSAINALPRTVVDAINEAMGRIVIQLPSEPENAMGTDQNIAEASSPGRHEPPPDDLAGVL